MSGKGYMRHKWSDEIKREVKKVSARDNWRWLFEVSEDFLVIILAIATPYFVAAEVGKFGTSGWGAAAWWSLYLVITVPIIGSRQRALAEILHQSAHKTLAANSTLNFIAGTFFSGYLVLQSWTAYFQSHVLHHHLKFGGDADPDYQYHIGEGLYEPQSNARFTWRYLISPLLLLRTPSKIVDLFRNRFCSPTEPTWEKLLKLSYIAAIVTTLIVYGYGWELLLFWVLPFLLSFPIFNWVIELTEHFPLVPGGPEDIHVSRNRWTGWLGKFLTGIHNEHLHLVHHLWPGVPAWRLPHVHRILMRDPEYRAVQDLEVGLLLPIVDGKPSILGSIATSHPHPVDPLIEVPAEIQPSAIQDETQDGG